MFIFPFLNYRQISIILLIATPSFLSCQKKEKAPSPEIVMQYQKSANLFCNAIVECLKEDVTTRLKDDPDRRDLILSRMNRDLCLSGQYSLIGKLSIDMSRSMSANLDPSIYKIYDECAKAVAESPDCESRRKVHKEHPSCVKLRTE